ncbi:MAG: DUF4167 domain-containing protein [Rhodobacteraceae bacterium]|nr:DUF4167 domain-containing protein [Paracoccaceae bacterium]
MRSSNKSRSRNKNQNQNRRPTANVVNRVFDSSGPEGKVRGTPQQIIDKYQALARDAQLSGDRVAAENFLQHSEHYVRLLNEAMQEQNARREQQEAQQLQQQQAQQRREAEARANADSQGSDQPDVAPSPLAAGDEADSNLVETPESSNQPRKRKPRSRPSPVKSENPDNEAAPQPVHQDSAAK